MSRPIGRQCFFCGRLHQILPTVRSYKSLGRWKATGSAPLASPSKWESVIGLEIHAQISSKSKLFSGAGTQYGANTNSQVSYFDAALPGTLPVLNKKCVEAGVLTSLALGCDINTVSKFDRKHYFYADIPAGYQITQQRQPLAVNGQLTYVYQCSRTSRVERRMAHLVQLQLEQDSGKSLHDPDQGLSLIDLNRAGVGLMEIVTAPDFTDGDDAASFVRDLRDILMGLGTCDGKMAEGSMRVDANISVNRPGEGLGVRTEVKNLNSFRSLRLAINFEIQRQIELLENGGKVDNETRSYDLDSGETVPMRDKEKLLDYRFMPEPNLPPLIIHKTRPKTSRVGQVTCGDDHSKLSEALDSGEAPRSIVVLEELSSQMQELPEQTRHRMESKYNQSLLNSVILVRSGLSGLFERLVEEHGCGPNAASHVVRNCISPLLSDHKITWAESPVSEEVVAEISKLFEEGIVSGASLYPLMEELLKSPKKSVQTVVEELGLWRIADTSLIMQAAQDVLTRNPKIIKAYKKGKTNQLAILAGKVQKQLENKADMKTVQDVLKEKLQ